MLPAAAPTSSSRRAARLPPTRGHAVGRESREAGAERRARRGRRRAERARRGRGAGGQRARREERTKKRAQRVAGRAQAGSATGAQEARTSSANAAEHRCSDDRPLQLSQQPAGGRAASRAHCALTAMTFRQVERARDEALQPVLPNVVRLLLVKLLVGVGRRGAVAGRWDLLQLGWREAGHHHRGKAQQHAARGLREQQDGHGGVSSQHDSNEQLCKNSGRGSLCRARLGSLCRTHAHTHVCSQACTASPCTEQGCSHVLRGRAREGAPCHRSRLPLPPTASPAHISHVAALLACGWPSPSSHARSSPRPRPSPHRAAPLCLQPLPVPTASPAARTSLGSRTGPSSMLSRLSLLPWQVRVGDPQAASAAVSEPSGPTPSPAATRPLLSRRHSPFPRPAVARARRPPSPIGLLGLLSDPSTPPPRGCLAYCTAWLYYICVCVCSV